MVLQRETDNKKLVTCLVNSQNVAIRGKKRSMAAHVESDGGRSYKNADLPLFRGTNSQRAITGDRFQAVASRTANHCLANVIEVRTK